MLRIAASLMVAAALAFADATAARAQEPVSLGSLKPEFFVVSDGDRATIITIGVAQELQKRAVEKLGAGAPWVIPQPSWQTADDIVTRCAHDPQAIGGVVVSYYHGYATHFYLLWQSETSTLDLSATVIACNRTGTSVAPTIVGIVGPLPDSNGTPWVLRRSQISIPLVSVAGYASYAANRNGNTGGALAGALLGGAADHDIPGYSDPVRLRALAQHVGVDLITGVGAICASLADVPAGTSSAPRTHLCLSLGF